jgi:DNA-binding response OmpR family regulator
VTRPPRILLVEDDPLALDAMSRLLRFGGYEVDIAATAAEAMAIASGAAAGREAHALVVSDIELPDAAGEALMRELRRRHRYVGIAITGHDDVTHRRDAEAAGFIGYFVKPVCFEDLMAAVDAAVGRHGLPDKPAAR